VLEKSAALPKLRSAKRRAEENRRDRLR